MLTFNKAAIVRVIIFILAWVNQILVSNGHDSLPVLGEEEVSSAVVFFVSVWTLFANNKMKQKKDESK